MKRLAIALCIIVLLVIFSPGFSILAQSTHIPHENPTAAKSSPDPAALLFAYSNVFNLTAIRQYQDAQSMLNELEYADVPDELQYIIDRYHTLSQQMLTTLNKVEFLLQETATLFLRNQISDAEQKLDETKATIHNAQFLLKDIEAANNTIANKLEVFAFPATSRIRQAYDRLEQGLQQPRELTNELNRLQQSVRDNPSVVIIHYPTHLEVSAPETAHPGLPITISGRVSSTDVKLERTIRVLLDNIQLTKENVRGKFSLEVTPPPQTSTGKHDLTVVATPQGRYSGASKKMSIDISRLPIQTDIRVPQLVIIPKPIQISGKVYHNLTPDHKLLSYSNQSSSAIRYIYTFHDNVDRTIKVLLDNTQLVEKNIFHQFCLEIITPPQTSSDQHSLKVVVTPQERYSGTSKRPVINISRIPPQAGILTSVRDAQVNLDFERSSATTKTATDGSFTTSVDIPFDLSLVGPQQIITTIEPAEPWYAPLQLKRRVFIINPAHMGLMLVAFFSLGLLVYNRVRTKVPVPQGEEVILQPQVREPTTVTPPSRPKYELTDIKGRILSAYVSGLEAVEKITGISMTAHTTLREFLKTATPRLPTAIKPFTELTTIAEVALYSVHRPDEDIATRANQLASTIKEELHSEAA